MVSAAPRSGARHRGDYSLRRRQLIRRLLGLIQSNGMQVGTQDGGFFRTLQGHIVGLIHKFNFRLVFETFHYWRNREATLTLCAVGQYGPASRPVSGSIFTLVMPLSCPWGHSSAQFSPRRVFNWRATLNGFFILQALPNCSTPMATTIVGCSVVCARRQQRLTFCSISPNFLS